MDATEETTSRQTSPPSLYLCTRNLRAEVSYFLKVKVSRQGIFKRNIVKKEELTVRTRSPNLLLLPGDFSNNTKFVSLPVERFQNGSITPMPCRGLPPYTPSIRFQLTMVERILQPGGQLSLQPSVVVPTDFNQLIGISRFIHYHFAYKHQYRQTLPLFQKRT